jgi:hypothetical protein
MKSKIVKLINSNLNLDGLGQGFEPKKPHNGYNPFGRRPHPNNSTNSGNGQWGQELETVQPSTDQTGEPVGTTTAAAPKTLPRKKGNKGRNGRNKCRPIAGRVPRCIGNEDAPHGHGPMKIPNKDKNGYIISNLKKLKCKLKFDLQKKISSKMQLLCNFMISQKFQVLFNDSQEKIVKQTTTTLLCKKRHKQVTKLLGTAITCQVKKPQTTVKQLQMATSQTKPNLNPATHLATRTVLKDWRIRENSTPDYFV